jgi:cobalt-zinc-cadmium efflux system protein
MATVHVSCNGDSAHVLDEARAVLSSRGLEHATVQVESAANAGECDGHSRCDD